MARLALYEFFVALSLTVLRRDVTSAREMSSMHIDIAVVRIAMNFKP
jgi:hypothetical protein